METKVNYTIVGLFVIALTAAIVMGIIWLTSGLSYKEYDLYRVYMNESVTGLSVDSPVKYNGVDVGAVKKIKLNRNDPQQVVLLLKIEEGTPITNSTTATLTAQGLTGVAYLDLQTRGNDLRPLKALPGQKYPVIKSAPSLFFRLDKIINELATNFNKLSVELQDVFDAQNRRAFKHTLTNLDEFTHTLAINSKHIDTILANTADASKKFPGFLQDGQNAMQSLKAETLPKLNQVLDNAKTISSNLADASRDIKQNPSVVIRGETPKPPGPGE